jgi:hypothetical protein
MELLITLITISGMFVSTVLMIQQEQRENDAELEAL